MHIEDNIIAKHEKKNCSIKRSKNSPYYTQKLCVIGNYWTTISFKYIHINGDEGTIGSSISKILVLENINQTIVNLTNSKNSKKDEVKIKESKVENYNIEGIKTIYKEKKTVW